MKTRRITGSHALPRLESVTYVVHRCDALSFVVHLNDLKCAAVVARARDFSIADINVGGSLSLLVWIFLGIRSGTVAMMFQFITPF